MRRGRLGLCLLLLGFLLIGWAWWRQAHTSQRPTTAPAGPSVAEQRLLDAAVRSPGDPAPKRALGRYYLQARQPFEALWELDQARGLDPQHRATRIDLATALAMAKQYSAAEAELRAALAVPGQPQAGRGELAALLLATGRSAEALAVLKAAPGLSTWPQGQLLLGRAEEGLGQTAAALGAYERYQSLSPGSSEGVFRRAHLLLTSGLPREARAALEAALRAAPREARLLQLLAMTSSARWGDGEQPDREGELLTTAIHLGPVGVVPARMALGDLYLRHRRFKEGGSELERVLERQDLPVAHRGMALALEGIGRRAEACYHQGMADVMEGHADLALRQFQAMTALAPSDPRAPQLISQTDAQMNQLDASLRAAERFYQTGNRSPELYERLATLNLITYNRHAARRLCEEWRRAQPASGRPLAYLGKISLDDLRLTEATAFYEQAVAKEPCNVEHLLGLADALGHQPSPENGRRAVELLRQAVALAPQDSRPHYQLGVALQQMGQWEAARRELLQAMDQDPSQAAAANNLLQVATALRQPALAARFGAMMSALRERKYAADAAWKQRWERLGDSQVYLDLARLLARSGDLTGAEYQLQRALQLRPGWAVAAPLREQVGRLLDGVDTDGRRLVQFPAERFTAERQRGAANRQ